MWLRLHYRKTIAGNDEGKKTAWRNGYEAANFAVSNRK
jgi:hypothetical protein